MLARAKAFDIFLEFVLEFVLEFLEFLRRRYQEAARSHVLRACFRIPGSGHMHQR